MYCIMSSGFFDVVGDDIKLIATWSKEPGETSGELIFNNLTVQKKFYETVPLNSAAFSAGTYTYTPVSNGDKHNVRLITNMGRNVVVENVSGKTVPEKMQITLEPRNKALRINLINYSTTLNESNGFNAIKSFDVFIDKDNDKDFIHSFDVADVVDNKYLVISKLDPNDADYSLENGQRYEIVVRAINDAGIGKFSNPATEKPSEKPAQIEDFAAVLSDKTVELSWSPSLEEYDLSYFISKKLSSASQWEEAKEVDRTQIVDEEEVFVTSYIFSGLENGTAYDFKIIAKSTEYGESPDAIIYNKKPFTIPAKMSDANIIITDLSNSSIFVRLTPPSNNGGKEITKYFMYIQTEDEPVNLAEGDVNVLDQSKEFVVSNLENGVKTTFMVYAMNSDSETHQEPWSKDYTQYANPSPVENLQVVNNTDAGSENGSVKLTWAVPENMGGADSSDLNHFIHYRHWVVDPLNVNMYILSQQETIVVAGNVLERVIEQLVVGKSYDFKVQTKFTKNAVNFVSAFSSDVSMIPNSPPDAPPSLNVMMANNKLDMKITWAQPKLYGLELSNYEYKVVLDSNPNKDNVQYVDAELNTEKIVQPEYYGVAYKVYVRAKTILSGCTYLTGEASVFTFTPYKAPSVVRNFKLYPLDGAVEVRWEAPSDLGGFTDVRYVVVVDGVPREPISDKNVKITGLNNEQVYIAVKPIGYINNAASQLGVGEHVVASTYPYSDPEPPTNLAVVPSDSQVVLTWAASASAINVGEPDAPVISYIIFRNDVKLCGVDVANGVLTHTDTDGLTNGVTYNYRVIAKQSFDNGSKITYSDNFTGDGSKSATPFKAPEPPSGLVLSASDKEIRADWKASPNKNGLGGEMYYRVEIVDKDQDIIEEKEVKTTSLTATFSGLNNGDNYTIKVYARAQNLEDFVGKLEWYENANFISATIKPNLTPKQPINVLLTPGSGELNLSWSAPTSDGYTTSSYEIYKNTLLVATVSSVTASYTISGLTNGDAYTIGIRRLTQSGEISNMYEVIGTPYGLPYLAVNPEIITVNSGKQVKLTVYPNGSPITNFIVFATPSTIKNTETYAHFAAPLSPARTKTKENEELKTDQLVISSNITSIFYVVSNAAGILTSQYVVV